MGSIPVRPGPPCPAFRYAYRTETARAVVSAGTVGPHVETAAPPPPLQRAAREQDFVEVWPRLGGGGLLQAGRPMRDRKFFPSDFLKDRPLRTVLGTAK